MSHLRRSYQKKMKEIIMKKIITLKILQQWIRSHHLGNRNPTGKGALYKIIRSAKR